MRAMTNPAGSVGDRGPRNDKQLRHDRIVGIVVLAVMLLLFGLLIWLASISGGDINSYDYWTVPL